MDMSSTEVPNLRRCVCAAVIAMATMGSTTQAGPTMRSENQMESQPWASSVSRYSKKVARPARAMVDPAPIPIRTDMNVCSLLRFWGRRPLGGF